MKRVVGILLCVALVAMICHRPLLRGLYGFLVRVDATENVAYVALFNGDRAAIDRARQCVQDGVAKAILIVERRPPRVVQIGVAPAVGERIKRDLLQQGIQESSVQIVSTDAVTNWQVARELDQYMKSRDAGARVAVLYPEHQTRYLKWIVERAVDPDRADHFDVWSFSPESYDADTWWKRRSALVKVAVAYLRFIHAVGFGEGDFDANNWSPESYQQSLQMKQVAKAA